MSEVLDLSGAQLGAFDVIPSNWYEATVFEITPIEIENDEGKLPMGTPGYNVQFKVEGGEYDNRRVFNRFYIPPPDYDTEKRKVMIGRFGDFLVAIGYAANDITGGKFKFDPDDAISRQLRISVGQTKDGQYNTVRNYKPVGGDVEEQGII